MWNYVSIVQHGTAVACNGADLAAIASDAGVPVRYGIGVYNVTDATTAINLLFGNAVLCGDLMDGANTQIGVGYAEDADCSGAIHAYLR